MSGQGAYGASKGSGDTARKTWDRDEYTKKAADHDQKSKEESKARYEAAITGKKYHARAATPPDAAEVQARQNRLAVGDMIGKTQLVSGNAIGRKGKGAGFYCDSCDITLKDSHSWVEHLNSKEHAVSTGTNLEVHIATKEEVRARLLWIKRKLEDDKKDAVLDIDTRFEINRQREEEERDEKRRKRNEKRRKRTDLDDTRMKYEDGDGVIC